MNNDKLDRRTVVQYAASWAALMAVARGALAASNAHAQEAAPVPPPAAPPAAAPSVPVAKTTPFDGGTVKALAKSLSEKEFVRPTLELPEPFKDLSYDQYRDIRFRQERALWRDAKLGFEVQPFPMGWLYDMPVEVWSVADGVATELVADGTLFTIGPLIGGTADAAPYGFSGFRIHGPLNRADYFDEFVVFQGASYLRAVGRGQAYGASARGLAINTARVGGEEFPFFSGFWIEKPAPGANSVVVHALLNSPSTTGAYRFVIQPGEATTMDVEVTLYPRTDLNYLGFAPLTSMFLHSPADQRPGGDFRPAVYDSEGLAIWNGSGERLWRQLTNPATLQVSAFVDKDVKGFGLWQRDRSFAAFEDLEANYQRRPSVWVEPKGNWGEGAVELIEIPVEDEIHDNIVVYWKPAGVLAKSAEHVFAYRLYWSEQVPAAWAGTRVAKTRVGRGKKPETFLFVIDLTGSSVETVRDLPVADVNASAGSIANVVVQRNPAISGIRVAFEMNPGSAEIVELRMSVKAQDGTSSETWLYRWTKP